MCKREKEGNVSKLPRASTRESRAEPMALKEEAEEKGMMPIATAVAQM